MAGCPGSGWEQSVRASERARALVLLVAAEWEAAATCFPKREAESREVCAVSVSRGRGRHIGRQRGRDPTRGARRAAGSRRAFVARKRQECSGSQRPRALARRTCRSRGAATSRGSEPGDAGWEGRWRGDVAGGDLTSGPRRIHELKNAGEWW